MENMNLNTKLEVAIEILAAKIALSSKKGYVVILKNLLMLS